VVHWHDEPQPVVVGVYGGTSPPLLKLRRDKPAVQAPVSLGKHATGKAEIFAQKSTVVARLHGQAVLQR
jgi:hypothetical protein